MKYNDRLHLRRHPIPVFQYARLPKKSPFRFITPGDLGLIISTIS